MCKSVVLSNGRVRAAADYKFHIGQTPRSHTLRDSCSGRVGVQYQRSSDSHFAFSQQVRSLQPRNGTNRRAVVWRKPSEIGRRFVRLCAPKQSCPWTRSHNVLSTTILNFAHYPHEGVELGRLREYTCPLRPAIQSRAELRVRAHRRSHVRVVLNFFSSAY